ncbi:MAG: hypothetical protein CMB80_22680 [Flammeovirgaceae bacterium]|nr:hypothetical protein [Flammeovirgaceae bacterium]MBE62792.1 hypothetical protein [Flammeovirgaceae bacterium]HCX22193.1 hypothetical protein [Cytophagales bacterium]|tara:strand:- start:1076 stop:2161 length:1086 start_codon:yes stop_codon:yes gene_type:complete
MQTRNSIVFIFILGLFLKYFNSQAQDSQMKFGAYLDSYFAFDFNNPTNNSRPYVTQYARHNEFNINHAWLKAQYDSEKIRGSIALQTGTYPQYNYAAEPAFGQMIYEAYAGYKLTKNGWLDIGIFGGHFGYESALSIDRELLSPALATEYTPYYQTGIKYTHDFSDKTQFRAVVVNGWQNIRETNDAKSIGVALDHQFNDLIFISYGNYYGVDLSAGGDVWRFHNNAIIQITPSEELSFTGIVDFTLQENAAYISDEDKKHTASFYTLISSYQFAEKWSVNGRYERVIDQDQVLIVVPVTNFIVPENGFDQHIISLSLNFNLTENASMKFEPKWYLGPGAYTANSEGAFVFQAGFAMRIGQ